MSSLLLVALLVAAPACRPAVQGDGAGRQALVEGRYGAAWVDLVVSERDPLLAARGGAEILYLAGDPAGALAAAEEGLREHPDDLELLHRAASSALWIGDLRRAQTWTAALSASVARADLQAEHRPAWEASVASFGERCRLLQDHADARNTAVRRARWTALVASLGVLLALAGLLR